MASQAHCAYCFESLIASFEGRQPLALARVQELWEQYHATKAANVRQDDDDEPEEPPVARPAAISRLQDRGAASSSSSLSSAGNHSSASSQNASGTATPATSASSESLWDRPGGASAEDKYPVFVTWNTLSRDGQKCLRGCIGTFEAQKLERGLHTYAVTSAFEDSRFKPIPSTLLPSLSAHVTLLTNFSTPDHDPLAWELGKHGLRIAFTHHGRRYGATYLPDVAKVQGWTKEETVASLMRKAGWNGNINLWHKAWTDGNGELITYEGEQAALTYAEWKDWSKWVGEQGTPAEHVN